jgi:asparagine synthase (glutamine-hydrolysing)
MEFAIRVPERTMMRIDKMSAAWSVEPRLPYTDSTLFDYAVQLPEDILVNQQPKHVLKKAAEGLLPADVIYREKLILPGEEKRLLRTFWEEARDIILESDLRRREIFNFAHIGRIMDSFERGTQVDHECLWNLFILFLWHRYWVEKKPI